MEPLILLAVMIFSGLAIFLKDLLKAVICLMISSIFLGIIFFKLGAPYAGVFEISVVAGLVMVLFILTISLVGGEDFVKEPAIPVIFFLILLGIFSLLAVFGFKVSFIPSSATGDKFLNFGQVLWAGRTFDMVAQISVIFGGVFVILAIVSRKGKNGK